ncbi:hypothetical protein V7O66_12565 [Methanolobus sp. ZRKC3]|uniref:hypothetical protein n=1 Tax=Methanolobus sp. ZRKC3 TaxID=3125786 RepID=UPI00324BDA98
MIDTCKQFVELRTQATMLEDSRSSSYDLVRKLTPGHMDRLLSISPSGKGNGV